MKKFIGLLSIVLTMTSALKASADTAQQEYDFCLSNDSELITALTSHEEETIRTVVESKLMELTSGKVVYEGFASKMVKDHLFQSVAGYEFHYSVTVNSKVTRLAATLVTDSPAMDTITNLLARDNAVYDNLGNIAVPATEVICSAGQMIYPKFELTNLNTNRVIAELALNGTNGPYAPFEIRAEAHHPLPLPNHQ